MDGKEISPAGAPVSPARVPDGLPLSWVVLFYGAMAGIAVLWRLAIDAPPIGWPGASELAIGVGAGLVVVGLSQWWTTVSPSGQELAAFLAEAIGRPGPGAVAVMAIASGFAEELLFRGALQLHAGFWIATPLFALAHYVPRDGLRVWAWFALLAGALFGGLAIWTDSLWPPILAHVTVNGVNLWWLSRRDPGAA